MCIRDRPSTVKAVKRGQAGAAGELKGNFDLTTDLGTLRANTASGIFGALSPCALTEGNAVPDVYKRQQALRGLAKPGRLCYAGGKLRKARDRPMIFDYTPKGVCSKKMRVTLDDQNVIEKVEVLGGCSGNLQGIASLVVGMPAQEAIRRMRGIRCGFKDTSCPDQLAHALEAALAAEK